MVGRFNSFSIHLSTLLYFILFALSTNALLSNQESNNTQRFPSFSKYVSTFHKKYSSSQEYQKRQLIYENNLLFIQKSNCNSCTVNQFSDFTFKEIQDFKNSNQNILTQNIINNHHFNNPFQSRILTQALPASYDWRNIINMTQVRNQGYCGASWAFSAISFFEQLSLIKGTSNSTLDLSESYLIACNPQNQGCLGGYVQSSVDKVIQRGGVPYQLKYKFNPDASVPATICLETDLFKVPNESRISYYRVSDPQTIKKVILQKPVIAGVCASDMTSYAPSSNSTPERTLKCKPQNRIIDHYVLIVGYTETEWIVRNHWGKNWGIGGYGYISRNPAQDCCIGEQLHTTGLVTQNCTVENCQTCVQNNNCYKCVAGRYVQYNLTTGVQTCELCTEDNCSECYNFLGTCKWCADGYAMNSTTGKCVTFAIANCNKFSSNLCMQCKPGYRLNSMRTSCLLSCSVKNCLKCAPGLCTQCKVGFSLTVATLNGIQSQFCILNNCSVSNCSYCNSTGSCVQCLSGFILQTNGTCLNNCTISGCVSCTLGSTTCSECEDGKSWNSTRKVCEVLNSTTNCKIHRTNCTTCKTGYTLYSLTRVCIQTCETSTCSACVKNDITLCTTCANGYFINSTVLNNITYYSNCIPNPCNIINCTLCQTNGTCLTCLNKYLTYNPTTNKCENQCQIQNCRDCLLNGTSCDFCNEGYCIDSDTGLCVLCNISNCLRSYQYNGTQFCWSCITNYYSTDVKCNIYCTDYWCQDCLITSLYVCIKCFDGYYMYLINGALTCQLIPSTMKGCDKVSYNQSYCYQCDKFYALNPSTGICELNTQGCPSMCQYCSNNQSYYFYCKCSTGVFQYYSQICIANPLNDSSCFVVQLYAGSYYCIQCLDGKIVNYNWDGCDPACIIPNCAQCQSGWNNYCQICEDGFYVDLNSDCAKCPFENCRVCDQSSKCLQCLPRYILDASQKNCVQFQCPPNTIFDGYQCVCPVGTYYTANRCLPCQQNKCTQCSEFSCFVCQQGYFVNGSYNCLKCPNNCKTCTSSSQCSVCNENFILDQTSNQCINPNSQGGSFYVSDSLVIRCPVGCLVCNNQSSCLQCSSGYVNRGGYCLNCQGKCKTCRTTNASFCTSCQNGYFLNQSTCIQCDDANCQSCQVSKSVCLKCKDGFFLANQSCQVCQGQGCLQCNFYGQCTKCASGYTLMSDYTCQQCGGNCRTCNSSSINQCYLSCNSSSYQLNGLCYSCPSNCLTCLSSDSCTSCKSQFVLRNGKCKKNCGQGCYDCDQTNSQVCLKCLVGYILSPVGTCDIDITCTADSSCSICPLKWALVNGSCEICNTQESCLQCQNGNINRCVLCQDGYFLNNSLCVACNQNCKKCSQTDRCQNCKDGFFLAQNQVFGNCQTCNLMCKTCSKFADTCTSCNIGYELSVTQKCLRVQKIEGEVELDLQLNNFPNQSKKIRDALIQMLGLDVSEGRKYYIIQQLREGSTILGFLLAVPQNFDADSTYDDFKDKLANSTDVGGVPVISVKKVELIKPQIINNQTNNNNTNNNRNPDPNQQNVAGSSSDDINKLAIILGIAIPGVIIILATAAFIFRKRLFKTNNGIENLPQTGFKQSQNIIIIQPRAKLPPIVSLNHGFTPLKQTQGNSFNLTTQNKTFFNSTGFPHDQQSYQRLDDQNEMSRVNDFDNTLNNIVAQLNGGIQNNENRILKNDKISEFNEDLSEIRGSQHEILVNKQQNMDDIVFADNSVRQFNEVKQQKLEQSNKNEKKVPQKSHLQIIQFEGDENHDLE